MVTRPDDRIAVGDDDLVPTTDRPDNGASGEMDVLEGPVGDLRGLQSDEFEGLCLLVAERRDGDDLPLADVMEDFSDGGVTWIDDAVDADLCDQRNIIDPVDEGNGLPGAQLFGKQ